MFIRSFVSIWIFILIHKLLSNQKVERKDLIKLAIAGFFGMAVNQFFFFYGLSLTSPVNASVIHASSPVLVLLFAAIAIRERITIYKGMGIALGLAGAILMILSKQDISLTSAGLWGDICIFINIVGYSIYMVMVKPLMQKYSPYTVTMWLFIFGFLFVLPFTAPSMLDVKLDNLNGFAWFGIGYIILGTTVLAYLITTHALKHLDAGVVGFYIYLQPVIATIIAVGMGTEVLTVQKLLPVLLIFTGVFLVSKKLK